MIRLSHEVNIKAPDAPIARGEASQRQVIYNPSTHSHLWHSITRRSIDLYAPLAALEIWSEDSKFYFFVAIFSAELMKRCNIFVKGIAFCNGSGSDRHGLSQNAPGLFEGIVITRL